MPGEFVCGEKTFCRTRTTMDTGGQWIQATNLMSPYPTESAWRSLHIQVRRRWRGEKTIQIHRLHSFTHSKVLQPQKVFAPRTRTPGEFVLKILGGNNNAPGKGFLRARRDREVRRQLNGNSSNSSRDCEPGCLGEWGPRDSRCFNECMRVTSGFSVPRNVHMATDSRCLTFT
ncbi:hypothetical protein Bbelb_091600 [Branchiostoma belcheri]|nr:hypothetical protein Bbelb_091600 [Branchiostoma belcheri]